MRLLTSKASSGVGIVEANTEEIGSSELAEETVSSSRVIAPVLRHRGSSVVLASLKGVVHLDSNCRTLHCARDVHEVRYCRVCLKRAEDLSVLGDFTR